MQRATAVTGSEVQASWLWEPAARAFSRVHMRAGRVVAWPFASETSGQKRNADQRYLVGVSSSGSTDGNREE